MFGVCAWLLGLSRILFFTSSYEHLSIVNLQTEAWKLCLRFTGGQTTAESLDLTMSTLSSGLFATSLCRQSPRQDVLGGVRVFCRNKVSSLYLFVLPFVAL